MADNLQDIVNKISSLSNQETVELISLLQEKFNISDSQLCAVSNTGGSSDESEKKADLKFDVFISVPADMSKVDAIKAVKEITGLGLKENKDIVEAAMSTPYQLKTKVEKAEADKIHEALKKANIKVELKEV